MSSPASALTFENIVYEKNGPIAHVTLNRPKVLNALNQSVFLELKAAFEDARDDASVRGVILTGSGDKAFAAGADIAEMSNYSAFQAEEATRRAQGVTELMENLGKPVIAAVNGFALGGGCELAMACTIRIASETAKFGQPEVKIGIMPGAGGTQRLPRLVGKGRALQLILSGEIINAQEAYRIGLVNELVPAADLIARAEAILNQINRQRAAGREVLDRCCQQRAGRERFRRPVDRGLAVWDLCRVRRQEGRHIRFPGKTSTTVPRAVGKPKSQS